MQYCAPISIQSANRTSRPPANLSELGEVRANGGAEGEWTWETQPKQGMVSPGVAPAGYSPVIGSGHRTCARGPVTR
jgi:hypothetical protein